MRNKEGRPYVKIIFIVLNFLLTVPDKKKEDRCLECYRWCPLSGKHNNTVYCLRIDTNELLFFVCTILEHISPSLFFLD